MNNTDQYLPFLKQVLTPPRLEHSLGVSRVMGELAEIYGLDANQAMVAGLLHDVAKDLPPEQQLALAQESQIELKHPCEQHPIYLHAPVSSYLCARELGITDDLVLDSITAHSHSYDGERFETLFSWCLRAADMLAPVAEWKGMKKLAHVVYAGKIEEASLLKCGWLMEYLDKVAIPVHPALQNSCQSLAAKLAVTDSFFERW